MLASEGSTYAPSVSQSLLFVIVEETDSGGIYGRQVSTSTDQHGSNAQRRDVHSNERMIAEGTVQMAMDRRVQFVFDILAFSRLLINTTSSKKRMAHPQDYTDEEVEDVFEEATTLIMSSKIPMADDQLLVFYGYYKQATVGKCDTTKPGFFDFKGKAKWYGPLSSQGAPLSSTLKTKLTPDSSLLLHSLQGGLEQTWRHATNRCDEAL